MNTKSDLAELLQASDEMSSSLEKLKQNIRNGKIGNFSPSQHLIEAVENRQILRVLAETLQRNRKVLQINKQKYQKSRTFLEGLEYYKATMKKKIEDYEINVENADEYVEEKIGEIDWQNGYDEGEKKIKQELQKIKAKTEEVQKAKQEKKELQKKVNQRKKLFQQTIPSQVRRLNQQVIQTCKLFSIDHYQTLEDIQNPKLSKIWDNLKAQQKACRISLKYTKEEYESIFITLKNCQYTPYKICQKNKDNFFYEGKDIQLPLPINIQQKEFVIQIAHLGKIYNGLVIGIDRHCGFSNFQMFNRLINDQQVKPIFVQPEKQTERNLNAKYILTEWLENMMISGFGEDILMNVRQRFCILQIFKSLNTFLPSKNERKFNQSKYIQIQNRITINSMNKITSEDYFKIIKVPTHISKSVNAYKLNCASCHQKPQKVVQHFKSLSTLLQKLSLEQLLYQNLNRYYNLKVSCQNGQTSFKLGFILIIPYQYPKKVSTIKIYQLTRQKINQTKRIPDNSISVLQIKNFDQFVKTGNFCQQQIQMFQESINLRTDSQLQKFTHLLSTDNNTNSRNLYNISRVFLIYLQLWKLFNLVSQLQ